MARVKVEGILSEHGIPYSITVGNIAEIQGLEDNYDVFMVTTGGDGIHVSKPVVPVFGLLSGINASQTEQQVVDVCRAVLLG